MLTAAKGLFNKIYITEVSRFKDFFHVTIGKRKFVSFASLEEEQTVQQYLCFLSEKFQKFLQHCCQKFGH